MPIRSINGRGSAGLVLALAILGATPAAAERPDRMLADFNGADYQGWVAEGTAFGTKPMTPDFFRKWQMTGYVGNGAAYSAPVEGGDGATGTLTSPEFTIDRRYLNFLLGGGNHPAQTCLELLVDGQTVASVPGGENNSVFWFSLDLEPWQGKPARIRLADRHSGGWGHVCADEISLGDAPRCRIFPDPKLTMAVSALAAHSAVNGSDAWRPRFHFQPRSGWMNDVNGPFFRAGWYHVFYQHHPFNHGFGKIIAWGHARSRDLVHWEQLPFAIWPEEAAEEVACWSGGMAFDRGGGPVLLYTAVRDWPATKPFVQSGAVPADAECLTWKKHPANPLLPYRAQEEPEFDRSWRDPFSFTTGGRTFMVVGATKTGMPIYEAVDDALGRWRYRGTVFPEDAECPNFFPLGDRFVFLSSAFQEGVKYTVGRLDLETLRYTPETRGVIDEYRNFAGVYGTGVLFDDQGRCIFLARVQGGRHGFNGYLATPRVLTLGADGHLRQQPVPAIESLRDAHEQVRDATAAEGRPLVLRTAGAGIDLRVTLEPRGARACGLALRRSADGSRAVVIRHADGVLDVAGTAVPVAAGPGQPLELRVLLDRIALEVFVGDGRQVVTKSVTPPDDDLGLAVFAEGGDVAVPRLDAWTMKPAPITYRDELAP